MITGSTPLQFGKIILHSTGSRYFDVTLTEEDKRFKPAVLPDGQDHFRLALGLSGLEKNEAAIHWHDPGVNKGTMYNHGTVDTHEMGPLIERMAERTDVYDQGIAKTLKVDTKSNSTPLSKEMASYPNLTYPALEDPSQRTKWENFTHIKECLDLFHAWVQGRSVSS